MKKICAICDQPFRAHDDDVCEAIRKSMASPALPPTNTGEEADSVVWGAI